MRLPVSQSTPRAVRREHALTLMELLVSVAVLSVIVLGLYSMFSSTQKALRANINQVDVLESGRATLDMITRELQELAACGLSNRVNVQAVRTIQPSAMMDLDGTTPLRTNVLQEVFFLTKLTNRWAGVRYGIAEPVGGVARLFRDEASASVREHLNEDLLRTIDTQRGVELAGNRLGTSSNFVAEGVVHFRLHAYDRAGRRLDVAKPFPGPAGHRVFPQFNIQPLNANQSIPSPSDVTVFMRPDVAGRPTQTEFFFLSNAVPAYLEVELGVLDSEAFKQFQSIRDTPLASTFLAKRANKVHLFRQRVPIRTAVP